MKTVEEIKKAINDFFGNRDRPRSETRDGLEEIMALVDSSLAALDDDERNEEEG